MSTDTDMETCSWCTEEVPDSELRESEDGARICRRCRAECSPGSGCGCV